MNKDEELIRINLENTLIDNCQFLEKKRQAQIARLKHERSIRLAVPLFVKEFYWTVSRIFGLSRLRDGWRRLRPPSAQEGSKLADLLPAAKTVQTSGLRILIESSDLTRQSAVTGVQRVAFNLAFVAQANGWGRAVIDRDGEVFALDSGEEQGARLEVGPNDCLLLTHPAEFERVAALIERVKAAGGTVVCFIHDIIPMNHPGYCYDLESARSHRTWFLKMLERADAMIAVSQSVADEILAFAASIDAPVNPKLRVAWSHHGAAPGQKDAAPSFQRETALNQNPFFLSVGSLEPRKGYDTALDAFETLWAQDSQVCYAIAGRAGWRSHALAERIKNHPQLGKKLFWFSDASDQDLSRLYSSAQALVQASLTEGFGLPIIEAAAYGMPVILSDIPVFREICGDHALYFPLQDSLGLARCVGQALAGAAPHPDFKILSWEEAAKNTFDLIKGEPALQSRWRCVNLRKIDASSELERKKISEATKRYDYIINNLIGELEYLERETTRLENDWRERIKAPLFLKEAYWTVTRLVGLGYLHDGSSAARAASVAPTPIPDWAYADKISHVIALPTKKPRILVEASFLRRAWHISGIPRVALSLAMAVEQSGVGIAIRIENGVIKPFFENAFPQAVLEIEDGDSLVLTEPSQYESVAPIIQKIQEGGGSVTALIYDIEILKDPGLAYDRNTVDIYAEWFFSVLKSSDRLIAISRYVLEDTIAFAKNNRIDFNQNIYITYNYLGGDLRQPQKEPSSLVASIIKRSNFFLSVGTIEPRKGYSIAIDAFDALQAQGSPASFVICGRLGWLSDSLAERIKNHRAFNTTLFWLEDVDDDDLVALYRGASALVQTSIAEGFGLPLIEAALHGAPLIVSDIPVFRELCGDHAAYFEAMNGESLAACMAERLSGHAIAPDFPIATWSQATQRLVSLIEEDASQSPHWRRF